MIDGVTGSVCVPPAGGSKETCSRVRDGTGGAFRTGDVAVGLVGFLCTVAVP